MSQVKGVEETDQADLIAYFNRRLESPQTYPPLQDDSPFLAGLTTVDFFALPESEQDRLWTEAHQEAERQLNHREKEVTFKGRLQGFLHFVPK